MDLKDDPRVILALQPQDFVIVLLRSYLVLLMSYLGPTYVGPT